MRRMKVARLLCILIFACACMACAHNDGVRTIKAQHSPGVFSVEDATVAYGEADAVVEQADGLIRHSWVYYDERKTRDRIYYYHEGGSPFREERVIKGKTYINYCYFNIYTDKNGVVKGTDWDGNVCDRMQELKQTKRKTNLLPEKEERLNL